MLNNLNNALELLSISKFNSDLSPYFNLKGKNDSFEPATIERAKGKLIFNSVCKNKLFIATVTRYAYADDEIEYQVVLYSVLGTSLNVDTFETEKGAIKYAKKLIKAYYSDLSKLDNLNKAISYNCKRAIDLNSRVLYELNQG